MAIVDWLFPRRCLGCGEVGEYICANCVNKLAAAREQICPMCLRPSLYGTTHRRCQGPSQMDGLMSVFLYQGLMERIITNYKYRYVSTLRDDLVEMITSIGDWMPLEKKHWLVVGIPLHPKRERWRGFNQAALLAQGVANYGNWEYGAEVLSRQKYTTPQMALGRKARLNNMAGAFKAGKRVGEIKNKAVLLVDDVWTTGATLREGAKVLKENGAEEVWGLTIARAV